ncbi:MAG: low molecular weight phosphotyrosine protein phosphatase [Holophagaceae bacterium]|nr:low molecular weight phosphotyrosine protein phosphatase [Holophagaceae bacterium]
MAQPTAHFHRILVLCEGNYCRSPMAECLLRESLGPSVAVESAGLGALHGASAAPEALELMAERGHDISAHRARQFTPQLALASDLILVMDRRQKARCEALVPSARGRVFLLGHWLTEDRQEIADPYRRGPAAFRAALAHIDHSVTAWLPKLFRAQRPA